MALTGLLVLVNPLFVPEEAFLVINGEVFAQVGGALATSRNILELLAMDVLGSNSKTECGQHDDVLNERSQAVTDFEGRRKSPSAASQPNLPVLVQILCPSASHVNEDFAQFEALADCLLLSGAWRGHCRITVRVFAPSHAQLFLHCDAD